MTRLEQLDQPSSSPRTLFAVVNLNKGPLPVLVLVSHRFGAAVVI
jgi:hypothetical protein